MTSSGLSARDALGGRWAAGFTPWAFGLLPGVIIVALQEVSLVHAPLGLLVETIALSSAVQSVAAGASTAGLAALFRRRWTTLPVPALLVIWLTSAVIRGCAGGFVAEALTGGDPLWVSRITAWVAVSVTWTPLFTYLVAQVEHRRRLLATLASLKRQRDREEERAHLSAGELRDAVMVTVRNTIRPLINEIRKTLIAVSGRKDLLALEEIGIRLSGVFRAADALLAIPAEVSTTADDEPLPARATVIAAAAAELRSPARVSLLSGVAILPVIIPMAVTAPHSGIAWGVPFAVAIMIVVLYLTTLLRQRLVTLPHPAEFASVIGASVLAGVAGGVGITAVEGGDLSRFEFITVLVLPVLLALSTSWVTLAMGVGIANRELVPVVANEENGLARARRRSAFRDAHVHDQLTALLHGPVQGRLSACVMALNFHLGSSDRDDPVKTALVTSAVLDHLTAASRDLETIPTSSRQAAAQS